MSETAESAYLERLAAEVRGRYSDLPAEIAEAVVQAAVSNEKDNLEGVGVLVGYVNERRRRQEAAKDLGNFTVSAS